MLTERRPGVPGITIPRLLVIFVCLFFFFQSDLPTQHQEMHSTLNEKKKGGMATCGEKYLKTEK